MGLGFLWYVTKVLLLQLKIKWAGLLFLCGGGGKSPSATPPLPPSDSPERTSVGAPDLYPIPRLLSIHLYPSYSISICTFASNATVVGVQRSFCFGVFNPGFTQFFVFFFLFFDHQHRSQMKDCTTGRLQNQTRDRSSFIR